MRDEPQEEYLAQAPPAAGISFRERIRALAEILAVAFLSILIVAFLSLAVAALAAMTGASPNLIETDSRIFFSLLFVDAITTVGIIWLLQRRRGQNLATLGLSTRDWAREIKIAAVAVAGLLGLALVMGVFFQTFLPEWATRENALLALLQTPLDLALFLVAGVCVGGFKEELQRAFILDRFDHPLGSATLGLFLWSFFFGAMHAMQGADSAVTAGLLGLALGGLYLWRRRLAAPMLAHAAFNTIMVLAVWFYPQLIDA